MSTSSKQDRAGARTPADLELRMGGYKANFATIMGIALDAQTHSEEAVKIAEEALSAVNELSFKVEDMYENFDTEALAEIKLKVDVCEATITQHSELITGHTESIVELELTAMDFGAKIDILAQWKSDVEEDILSIADIKLQVDDFGAEIESLASFKEGVTESVTSIRQEVNDFGAEIELLADFKNDVTEAITSIRTEVNDWGAEISSIAEFKNDVTEAVTSIRQEIDDFGAEIELLADFKAGVTETVASIRQDVDDWSGTIEQLVNFDNGVTESITSINQTVNSLGGQIIQLSEFDNGVTESLNVINQRADDLQSSLRLVSQYVGNSKIIVIESVSDLPEDADEEEELYYFAKDTGLYYTYGGNAEGWIEHEDCPVIISNAIARIEQRANENRANISLIVEKGMVNASVIIEAVNKEESVIRLTGDRLVVESTNLEITEDGTISALNGHFMGEITATRGNIGGWEVLNDGVFNDLHYYDADLGLGTGFQPPNSGAYALAVGYSDPENWNTARFRVNHAGEAIFEAQEDYDLYGDSDDGYINAHSYIKISNSYIEFFESLYGGKYYIYPSSISFRLNNPEQIEFLDALVFQGGNYEFCLEASDTGGMLFANTGGNEIGHIGYRRTPSSFAEGNRSVFEIGTDPNSAGWAEMWLNATTYDNNRIYGSWEFPNGEPSYGSDRNIKKNIEDISDKYSTYFDNLSVKTFEYIEGNAGRKHAGIIAQDAYAALDKAGLTSMEFAGVCVRNKGTEDELWTIRMGEFTALCIHEIQKLKREFADFKARIGA